MSDDARLDEFVKSESESSEPAKEDLVRKTVCGIPPQDWTVERLGELVRVVSGNSLPTEYQDEDEAEHPVYKVSDMNTTGNKKYISESSNWLSKEELDEINHTLYPEGTIILPKVGAALLTNKRRILTEPSSFDNNVMGWVPDEINSEFLYYVSCMIDMEAVAQKGAVPSISKAIAKSLKLPSPPLPEQHKIATVLSTIDRAIEKTEEIIEQKERIRTGLIQDLFTGVDIESIKSVRLSAVDTVIPEHWDVETVGNVSKQITDGAHLTPDRSEDGYLLLSARNVKNGYLDLSDVDYVPEKEYKRLIEKCNPQPGDILISCSGTVGRVCKVPENLEFALVRSAALVKFDNSVLPSYAEKVLQSNGVQKQIKGYQTQSAQPNLFQGQIASLEIPIPPAEEQRQIAKKLDDVSESISSEQQYKSQLIRLKHGLQQDLLSGTVRTTDSNIEVPDEIAQHG